MLTLFFWIFQTESVFLKLKFFAFQKCKSDICIQRALIYLNTSIERKIVVAWQIIRLQS
jgi:hypothetical protein